MAPFPLESMIGKAATYIVYAVIGFSFGWVLEIAGFGNSRKLAMQFYFKDMTVLKVMFTAIVTAMVLIFASSGLGLLDYNRIWVNPTYLWPGIAGGVIMGIGFIIGGFCPGTSMVALATLKMDGLFFFLGTSTGILIFGESVDHITEFYNSGFMGRYTLPEFLGLPTGIVVLLAVLMALFMFWGAEKLERLFGGDAFSADDRKKSSKIPRLAAVLTGLAVFTILIGQPTAMDRWEKIKGIKQPLIEDRSIYIHPGELVSLMHNNQINLMMYDLRDEADYNLFHLRDAKRIALSELDGPMTLTLLTLPANSVIILMSNDEDTATTAWQMLTAQNILNVYILEHGINGWLDTFGHAGHSREPAGGLPGETEQFRHYFDAALGSGHPSAEPAPHVPETLQFTPKVQLQKRKAVGGGCS